MSFRKVVFLRYLPLTQKISKDFYFEEISASGIKVEYWDVSFLLTGISQIEDYRSDVVRKFSSYSEISRVLKGIDRKSTLFVLIMTYNGDVLHLYSILSKYKCILSVFGKNMFPTAPFSKSSVLVSSKFTIKLLRKILLNKMSVLAKKYHFVKNYDILFLAGKNGASGIGRVTREELIKSQKISINSDDYDRFFLEFNQHNCRSYRYAVFLDEYLPLHQDLELVGLKAINAKDYYDSLNKLFSEIEAYYGVRVIIAAHPKAVRYKTEDFFDGREVAWGETATLCNNCEFVLAHDSTSINYAVLSGKPIISLISDDIINTSPVIADSIKAFSEYLHTPIVNIDRPRIDNFTLGICNESYTNYKYDFLTSLESENKRTVDVLIEFLHNDK